MRRSESAPERARSCEQRVVAWAARNSIDRADIDLLVVDTQPNLLIDDDVDDLNFITEALMSLNVSNEIYRFDNAPEFLEFLKKSDKIPFFILCDVNMSQMNGYELLQEINKDERLRSKLIPFLFLSTAGTKNGVTNAYKMAVQGYFKKPDNFDAIKACDHSSDVRGGIFLAVRH